MKICITGGSGFLGSHVVPLLLDAGHDLEVLPGRGTWDLTEAQPWYVFEETDVVIHLAYPGTKGIQTSLEAAADLVHEQLLIDLTVICQAAARKVQKLICIGSVCEYPEHGTYPMGEDQLWHGYPEAVNAPYGIAKRMQQGLLEAYRRQYGLQSTQLILGNLYGPGDRSGHVIPSLIRKACHSLNTGDPYVIWGDGSASREFLHVEDAARAIVAAVEAPPQVDPINIVSGEETPIWLAAGLIADAVGWRGKQQWDLTKPNGQPRRWFKNARAQEILGWSPQVRFKDGVVETVQWLREQEHL